ncbi:MAG: T9SS type A sorting domain-containing protein [Saprospiraceae bacterium]|nr:T9SS type A sorting domain-containing protein [Saprospiraceae bacterium]
MKQFNLSLSFFLLFLACSFGQKVDFIKVFGKPGYEDIRSMVFVEEKDQIVFTGLTMTANDPEGDVYLCSMDARGEIVKYDIYGKKKEDGGNGILKTSDGGFLISGHTELPIKGIECDAMATKINSYGELEWQVNLGDSIDETSYAAVEDQLGNFWVVGTRKIEYSNRDVSVGILFKLDKTGDLVKTLVLPYSFVQVAPNSGPLDNKVNRRAIRVYQVEENYLMVGGIIPYLASVENGHSGFSSSSVLWKINMDSIKIENEIRIPSHNSSFTTKLNDMFVDTHRDKILVFGTSGFSETKKDTILSGHLWIGSVCYSNLRSDSTFVSPFDTKIKGSVRAAVLGQDGKIRLCGEIYDSLQTKAFWAVLNQKYELEKWDYIDLSNNSTASSISIGKENDIFIGGQTWTPEESQMFVTRIFPFEATGVNSFKPSVFSVGYLASAKKIVINTNQLGLVDPCSFQMINKNGMKILNQEIYNPTTEIDLTNLAAGIYFFQIYSKEGNLQTGKVVIH